MKRWIIPEKSPIYIFYCPLGVELTESLCINSQDGEPDNYKYIDSQYQIELSANDIFIHEEDNIKDRRFEALNSRLKSIDKEIYIQFRISDDYIIAVQNCYIGKPTS